MVEPRVIPGLFLFAPERPRVRTRFGIKRYVLAISLLALANLACSLSENFHTVIDHKVYRSAQLGSESLESHIAREGVRSIVNLRGFNPGREWYQQECAVAMRNGVRHFDLPIDSDSPPTGQELADLVQVLKTCPKPVLLHCQSGIDRSGVAAAISVLLLDKEGTLDKALDQLSLRFGHLPWKANLARQYAFLQEYGSWLAARDWLHSPARFQQWLALLGSAPASSLHVEAPPAP
jgi:protein tyrosine/serine phosphatase